jgi:hypothetical protein
MISALLLITQYMYDFSRTDVAFLAELRETDYVRYVQTALNGTASTFASRPDSVLNDELTATENFMKSNLAERGMEMSVKHVISVGNVNIKFNITAPGFFSQTAFTVSR